MRIRSVTSSAEQHNDKQIDANTDRTQASQLSIISRKQSRLQLKPVLIAFGSPIKNADILKTNPKATFLCTYRAIKLASSKNIQNRSFRAKKIREVTEKKLLRKGEQDAESV